MSAMQAAHLCQNPRDEYLSPSPTVTLFFMSDSEPRRLIYCYSAFSLRKLFGLVGTQK